jgi:hypothetical protein
VYVVRETITSDQCRNLSRSANGTPSSSQITVIGIGNASAWLRSTTGPCSSIASISSSVICWMRGCRLRTRRAVNWPATSDRSLVCSGGSMVNRLPGGGVMWVSLGALGSVVAARLNRWSDSTTRASSYLLTT